jgi:hypothetical protein
MRKKLFAVLLACSVSTVGTAYAQTLDQEMPGLADKIGKSLAAKGSKSVAAVDFTDIEGQSTELGRFLSEQLTVEIVATSSVSMVDRANIKHILAEHNLTVEGLVDPANAKKLGEFAGVDTILVGSVTEVDDGYRLMVKAISTSSNQIITAGWITFKKTPAIQDIANRGVPPIGTLDSTTTAPAREGRVVGYHSQMPIATKDLGSLRVALKSIMPVEINNQGAGVRVALDFTSRETQRSMVVAINGESQSRSYPPATRLRASVLDDQGGLWSLEASDLVGLSCVRVGVHGRDGQVFYNPSDIIRLLQLRDALGRDRDDPADGEYANATSRGAGGYNTTWGSAAGNTSPRKFFAFAGNIFVSGSTTEIGPGQTVSAIMTFFPKRGEATAPLLGRSLQFHSEIVVGVPSDRKHGYTLYSLSFDRVSLQAN